MLALPAGRLAILKTFHLPRRKSDVTYWSREEGLVIYNPSSMHKEELELLSLELGYWARLLDL